jgi:hypothetical protein
MANRGLASFVLVDRRDTLVCRKPSLEQNGARRSCRGRSRTACRADCGTQTNHALRLTPDHPLVANLGRKVDMITWYDGFTLDPPLDHAYSDMVAAMEKR